MNLLFAESNRSPELFTYQVNSLLGLYSSNLTLYVGVGITVAMLAAGVAILYVWCKYRTARPGYTAGRAGKEAENCSTTVTDYLA